METYEIEKKPLKEDSSLTSTGSSASTGSSGSSVGSRDSAALPVLSSVCFVAAILISVISLTLSVVTMHQRTSVQPECVPCSSEEVISRSAGGRCCVRDVQHLSQIVDKILENYMKPKGDGTHETNPSARRGAANSVGDIAGHSTLKVLEGETDLYLSLHQHLNFNKSVARTARGFQIIHKGLYFIYSKVTVLDYHDAGEAFSRNLVHRVEKLNPLYPTGREVVIETTKTKSRGSGYSENDSFVAGVFWMHEGEEIVVSVKGVNYLNDEHGASYLGLLKI